MSPNEIRDENIVGPTPAPGHLRVFKLPLSSINYLLLKSPVRHYAKQTLNEAKGLITVVNCMIKRLTFVECNDDLNHDSMIDIGKIADLVLIMVDGCFSFKMVCTIHLQKTFEFLNSGNPP